MVKPMGPRSWVTGWQWRERILNFEPSWFTAVMSTGTVMQTYVNFPYPITGGPGWLRDIGYCLWILEICLFVMFTVFLLVRYIRHPVLFRKNVMEFPQSSYFGAIPISFSTIIVGITSYYNYRTSARWAAFVMWWIDLVLTMLVSIGLVTIQTMSIAEQEIGDVAGLWLMTTVPLFTLANAGSTLLPYLTMESQKCALIVLIISFCCWAFGMFLATFILAIYLFRLLSKKLPGPKLLASSFLPVAALSQAAFAILDLSIYLASYVHSGYAPTQEQPPPLSTSVLESTAEAIHWMGILMCLGLLAHASFWLVQATTAMLYQFPKQFNIGLWSIVFPIASYTNTWSFLSRDLRQNGMRGYAATFTVIGTILWLLCAIMTSYLGFWEGSLFSAPGLDDWLHFEEDGSDNDEKKSKTVRRELSNGTYVVDEMSKEDEESGQADGEKDGETDGYSNGHMPDGESSQRRR